MAAAEEDAVALLKKEGVEDWPDLASFTDAEFEQELAPQCDGIAAITLRLLRAEAQEIFNRSLSKRARTGVTSFVLPGQGSHEAQEPTQSLEKEKEKKQRDFGALRECAQESGTKSEVIPGLDEGEATKRLAEAKLLAQILTRGLQYSTLKEELNRAEEDGQGAAWVQEFIVALASGAEAGTLSGNRHKFNKWDLWVERAGGDCERQLFNPPPLLLRKYLSEIAIRGKTVACSFLKCLDWFEKRLGFTGFSLRSPLIERYRAMPVGEEAVPVPAMELAQYRHLKVKAMRLLSEDWTPEMKEPLAAALVLRLAVTCLRFGHVKRATRIEEDCSKREEVWSISRGKKKGRQPFKIGFPIFIEKGKSLFSKVHDILVNLLGEEAAGRFLMPDVVGSLVQGLAKADFKEAHMPYHHFRKLLNFLLRERHEDEALHPHGLRRFLASIANGLELSDKVCNSLGNWVDNCDEKKSGRFKGNDEPMNVRYSAVRLRFSCQSKRLCLAVANHVCVHLHIPCLDAVIQMKPHVDLLDSKCRLKVWGDHGEEGEMAQEVPPPSDDEPEEEEEKPAEEIESETSNSSDGSSATVDVESLLAVVPWMTPVKEGLLHVINDIEDKGDNMEKGSTALCGWKAAGCLVGTGKAKAELLGKPWCTNCQKSMEPELRLAFKADD